MQGTEKKRSFLINLLYVLVWIAIIYVMLKFAMPFLMPFVIAFSISLVLKPLINFLGKKLRFVSRKVIAIIILTLTYAVLAFLLIFFSAKFISGIGSFMSTLPNFYNNTIVPAFTTLENALADFFGKLDPSIVTALTEISDSILTSIYNLIFGISSWALTFITNAVKGVPSFIASFFIMLISSYFFAVDYYKITGFLTKQLSDNHKHKLFVIKDFVINVIFKFISAYMLIMLITFCELSVGLLILRVPNAFLIAAGIAVLDILPILGSGAILIPWTIYSLAFGDFWFGIGLLILYVAITIIRQIIEPRIIGKQIGLYPIVTLIAMFVGARLFGIWGIFGFPIALTVIIHLNKTGEIKIFKK